MANKYGILTSIDEIEAAEVLTYKGPNYYAYEGKFMARLDYRAWTRGYFWPAKLNCYFTLLPGRERIRLSAIKKPGRDEYYQRHSEFNPKYMTDGKIMKIEIGLSKRGNFFWDKAEEVDDADNSRWEDIFDSDRMKEWLDPSDIQVNPDDIYIGKFLTDSSYRILPCYCNDKGKWINTDMILGKKDKMEDVPEEVILFRHFNEKTEINRDYELLHVPY